MDGITDSMDMSLSRLQELVMDREVWRAVAMGLQRVEHNWVTEVNCTCYGYMCIYVYVQSEGEIKEM